MLVVYRGHDPVLLTDYNGTTYAFHKDIPIEIAPEIYNNIIQSGHISATDVVPCEAPKVEEPKKIIVEKETIKPKGRKKYGHR